MQSALQQSVCFRGTVATDDYLLSKNHWIPRVFHRPDDLQLFTPIATAYRFDRTAVRACNLVDAAGAAIVRRPAGADAHRARRRGADRTRTDRSFGKVVEASTKLQLDGIGYYGGGLSGLPVVSVPTAMLAMKRINHAPPMLSRPHAHPCRTRLDATSSTASIHVRSSPGARVSRARRSRSRASRSRAPARPRAALSTPAGPPAWTGSS